MSVQFQVNLPYDVVGDEPPNPYPPDNVVQVWHTLTAYMLHVPRSLHPLEVRYLRQYVYDIFRIPAEALGRVIRLSKNQLHKWEKGKLEVAPHKEQALRAFVNHLSCPAHNLKHLRQWADQLPPIVPDVLRVAFDSTLGGGEWVVLIDQVQV